MTCKRPCRALPHAHAALRQAIAKAVIAFYQKFVDEQSKQEIKKALLLFDRTLLVADPRRAEPKKWVEPAPSPPRTHARDPLTASACECTPVVAVCAWACMWARAQCELKELAAAASSRTMQQHMRARTSMPATQQVVGLRPAAACMQCTHLAGRTMRPNLDLCGALAPNVLRAPPWASSPAPAPAGSVVAEPAPASRSRTADRVSGRCGPRRVAWQRRAPAKLCMAGAGHARPRPWLQLPTARTWAPQRVAPWCAPCRAGGGAPLVLVLLQ